MEKSRNPREGNQFGRWLLGREKTGQRRRLEESIILTSEVCIKLNDRDEFKLES